MATRKKKARQPDYGPKNGPVGPWSDRVQFSDTGEAYTPGEMLCSGDEALEAAVALITRLQDTKPEVTAVVDGHWQLMFRADLDVEAMVDRLRARGFAVDPNNVFFTHSANPCCGGCTGACHGGLGANPYFANSMGANPYFANAAGDSSMEANPYFANAVMANPYFANPYFANPYFANPYFANPYFANPYFANYQTSGERPSSARPAATPTALPQVSLAKKKAKVFILDTGLAADLPPFLDHSPLNRTPGPDRDHPDESHDGFLDPASGHGTFIAGILDQLAPGQDVRVCRVLSTFGEGKVSTICGRLDKLRRSNQLNDKTIINLSFGGYVDSDTAMLADTITRVQDTGAVVVASAGNDGVCRPSYPAALPGVIAVGSIEPHGRAPYSNFGPWVNACAPGTNVVSSFFADYNGGGPRIPGPTGPIDPDHFMEWAQWTGTSFAGPVVVAALMRHMALTGSTAADAATLMVESPGLVRHPGLGTVISLVAGT